MMFIVWFIVLLMFAVLVGGLYHLHVLAKEARANPRTRAPKTPRGVSHDQEHDHAVERERLRSVVVEESLFVLTSVTRSCQSGSSGLVQLVRDLESSRAEVERAKKIDLTTPDESGTV